MKVAAGQPCPLCESPLASQQLAPFSGDEDPLRVTLSRMPVLRCSASHTYFARRDFPMWLMTQLLQESVASLPSGESKGFLLRKHYCGDCGRELERRQDHRHSFHFDLAPDGAPAFAVELTMPVFKCSGCGKQQVHSLQEVRKLAPAALVHAFKAAGIKAPG